MRSIISLSLFALFICVYGKTGVKATESMGQEIIEIGTPLRALPPEIEEEPSAEVDDDYKQLSTLKSTTTTTTTATTTKKEVKKVTAHRRSKDLDASGEDDIKVEQELNEVYKDTNQDYKDIDNKKTNVTFAPKPVARMRNNFKFQPDLMNPKEVERFRTSVDEISCDQSTKRLLQSNEKNDDGKPQGDDAIRSSFNTFLLVTSVILANC